MGGVKSGFPRRPTGYTNTALFLEAQARLLGVREENLTSLITVCWRYSMLQLLFLNSKDQVKVSNVWQIVQQR